MIEEGGTSVTGGVPGDILCFTKTTVTCFCSSYLDSKPSIFFLFIIPELTTVYFACRAMERGRVKCGQYWPKEDESEDQFGEFIVINNSIETYKEFIVTVLSLHNTKVGITTIQCTVEVLARWFSKVCNHCGGLVVECLLCMWETRGSIPRSGHTKDLKNGTSCTSLSIRQKK